MNAVPCRLWNCFLLVPLPLLAYTGDDMRLFVTGATGYIGAALVEALLAEGIELRVLVRDPAKAAFLAGRPGLAFVDGSLEDEAALAELCADCEGGFNLAGLAKAAPSDPGAFDRINVEGARAVAAAARTAGCRRLVHTSSAGVLGPSLDGREQSETSPRQLPFLNDYERTKAASEVAVLGAAGGELEVVIVNPTRVYGPSPSAELTPYNLLISRYLQGSWRILPGRGGSVGDYAFIGDVVAGELAAYRRGRPGERYLLGGQNLSYAETFALAAASGGRPRPLRRVPIAFLMIAAGLMVAAARVSGKEPLITPGWLRRFTYDWRVSSAKAEAELGYRRTPAEDAMRATVAWLVSRGLP